MRKILLSVILATTLALTSCQFDDSALWGKLDEYGQSIKDHEQRISALEELCKQMNTNIEALQTLVDALEKRDYVTNVSEVRSNGEVIGYTISFAYSDTITIYHGKDGQDGANGADGKDGYTPQIGVMKDTDNVYYWTLDGEWLLDAKGNKIKAVGTDGADGKDGQNGTNGSDGKDGQDGTNGTDGKDGADGKDGITPQLKIENDYWYVSYDNGATWVQLGKATGEDGKDGQDGNDGADGSDGADGEDGDSIFKSVTQDDEYVYFNLADGTMITLPKHDKENIQFEDLQVKAICCKNWDTNNDGELSYAEAAAVTTIGTKFKGNTNIIAFTELRYFTGITEIPANAFNGCTALWKIKIPENVLTIGSPAFNGCIGMNSFTIPNSVTSIGKLAFYDCTSLTSVTIPDSVTSIGDEAFLRCTSLTRVDITDLSAWCKISFGTTNTNPLCNGAKLYLNG
ncbi:MAG: leucine-rich repeat protein, partial [Muribaculaceae bacterium]|nr:leucine-rich repeat protein [Muribaculaceae bacterium]